MGRKNHMPDVKGWAKDLVEGRKTMNIQCECGGNEFEAVVPGRVLLLVNQRGQVQEGFAEVRDATLPTKDNQFQCIACAKFATVEA